MNHNLHPVFRGLTTDEYQELTNHTRIHEKEFPKGALIFQNADLVTETGIILTGSVHIENTDFWGSTSLLGGCRRCICRDLQLKPQTDDGGCRSGK